MTDAPAPSAEVEKALALADAITWPRGDRSQREHALVVIAAAYRASEARATAAEAQARKMREALEAVRAGGYGSITLRTLAIIEATLAATKEVA